MSAEGTEPQEEVERVPEADPSDAVDAALEQAEQSLSLAEREERWGFSLEALKNATHVVRTLFNNPSLFVGDPYLAESRLYTMITRDRKTKRENREVYKQIMSEERSRRRRYQRLQDVEAVRKTTMKREREEALQALLAAPPPLLICENESVNDGPTAPSRDAAGLLEEERSLLRLVGAYENVKRLEAAFKLPSSDPRQAIITSQLIAQVYRYLPHACGTEMPYPILPLAGENSDGLGAERSNRTASGDPHRSDYFGPYTVAEMKCRIAWLVQELAPLSESAVRGQKKVRKITKASGLPPCLLEKSDVMVCDSVLKPALSVAQPEDALPWRDWSDELCDRGEGEEKDTAELKEVNSCVDAWNQAVLVPGPSPDILLRDIELTLFKKGGEGSSCFAHVHNSVSTNEEGEQKPSAAAYRASMHDMAELTLDLFIIRRLYRLALVRRHGPAPIVIEAQAPTSEAEEPDSFSVFDELQLYARETAPEDSLKVSKWVGCYTCKVRYQQLHPFYYSMCHLCGEFNYNKRLMTADLRGKNVLLTGCRIKIGYAMALSLLRCGARLLGTTRFAHAAVARFMKEPDYTLWSDRLHLFSLDLRDMSMTTQFCFFVRKYFGKLYAIINNAAQTIARKPSYTADLRALEEAPPVELRQAIEQEGFAGEWNEFFSRHSSVAVGFPTTLEGSTAPLPIAQKAQVHVEEVSAVKTGLHGTVTTDSFRSQGTPAVHFDRYDTLAEESDTREANSWVMKLGEVSGGEAAEVMAINALSPFILNAKLKPCLLDREGDADPHEPRFIINVSAMEGQFYRFKQTTHPHTNMAKAALNMMSRTSGEDYAADGIYMNSVDTGWITDESPKAKKERRAEQMMLCPLDEVDAAARCLDLIYTRSREYGKFYKDFKEIPW